MEIKAKVTLPVSEITKSRLNTMPNIVGCNLISMSPNTAAGPLRLQYCEVLLIAGLLISAGEINGELKMIAAEVRFSPFLRRTRRDTERLMDYGLCTC